MHTEWILIAGFFLVAALIILRQLRGPSVSVWLGGAAVLLIGCGLCWGHYLQKHEVARKEVSEKLPHPAKNEYVSSIHCRSCHPQQYASWHRSFHRTMTQVASPESVRGNFNNLVLKYDGDDHRVERRGNEFWVELVDPDWKLVQALKKQAFEEGTSKIPPVEPEQRPKVWKRIDMLTGSHHMQACWVAGDYGNQQFIFPFIYLFEDQRWVPREDAFLKDPSAPRMVQVWNGSCIRCHATAGKPLQDPKNNIFQTEVAELGIACEACHGPAYEHVQKNRDPFRRYALHARAKGDPTIVNPRRLDSRRGSEVCGTCHGVKYIRDNADWMAHGFRYRPGKKLEDDAPILIRLAKVPDDPRFPEEVRKHPEVLHGTFWPDGMVRVSGRDYSALIESPCFQRGEISCMSCHSMHKSDPDDQLAEQMDGNQACLQCHDKFRNDGRASVPASQAQTSLSPLGDRARVRGTSTPNRPAASSAQSETVNLKSKIQNPIDPHTHHLANSSGSLCYNCHMPHTTYGLLKSIRSHTISSPNVQVTLNTGRPNACNLCHLDKSLGWTATKLSEWYRIPAPNLTPEEQNTAASVLWALRGDAGQRALLAWHMGWEPALKASGADWVPLYLSQLLTDSYSAVRYLAKRSLKRLPDFAKLDYDYLAPAPELQAAQQKAFRLAANKRPAPFWNPAVLIDSNGSWQTNQVRAFLQQRDDHYMELLE